LLDADQDILGQGNIFLFNFFLLTLIVMEISIIFYEMIFLKISLNDIIMRSKIYSNEKTEGNSRYVNRVVLFHVCSILPQESPMYISLA